MLHFLRARGHSSQAEHQARPAVHSLQPLPGESKVVRDGRPVPMSLALGTGFTWLISLCFLECRMEVLVSGELLRLQAHVSGYCKSSGKFSNVIFFS